MQKKSYSSWLISLLLVATVIYFGYKIVHKQMQKRVVAEALEKGVEAVAERLEKDHERMAEDLGALMERIDELEGVEVKKS